MCVEYATNANYCGVCVMLIAHNFQAAAALLTLGRIIKRGPLSNKRAAAEE